MYAIRSYYASRTSIATSTGQRISTRTCVGYPKDIISRKRLNKPWLLGDEALENRLALNMVWPLAEGVICNDEKALEATGLILKHIIAQALPGKKPDDLIYAAVGVPAQASFTNKRAILDVTRVITSYSIHYTKLYDTGRSGRRPPDF